MYISRIHIEGFKRFTNFDLELDPAFNVIVGNNETGKSSLLEAVAFVVNGQYAGRPLHYGLDSFMFNANAVREFFSSVRSGKNQAPPTILIEAYINSAKPDPLLAALKGTNNSRSQDSAGLTIRVEPAKEYVDELKKYAADLGNPELLPVEFYTVTWRSFADNAVSHRGFTYRAATINVGGSRAHRAPERYLSQLVSDILSDEQQRSLSLEYKRLRHRFAQEEGVQAINKHLEDKGNPGTDRKLAIQMDMSSRSSWDSAISPHLDDLPFDCAGKGEQSRIQLRLAIAGADKSRVLLVEEPENHLSHTNLNRLLDDLRRDRGERQVIATTHSAFVLNKLGLDTLKLVSAESKSFTLSALNKGTSDYFMKLPGYDTLRLILARRSILVEGPSDELIVQKAYKNKYGKLPIEDGVEVIAVGSLAFKRFLEIARILTIDVRVVTDNDGNVQNVKKKYAEYMDGKAPSVTILYDADETRKTLEPQLLKANTLSTLNHILGTAHENEDALLTYMANNKTDCALRLFSTGEKWTMPKYIDDAVA